MSVAALSVIYKFKDASGRRRLRVQTSTDVLERDAAPPPLQLNLPGWELQFNDSFLKLSAAITSNLPGDEADETFVSASPSDEGIVPVLVKKGR